MDELFEQLRYWHWWSVGVVLLIAEVTLPAFFFLWLGVAAGVTGVVLFLAPALEWKYQLTIFSVISIVAIVLWHGFVRRNPIKSDQPGLNQRGRQYLGRVFTLEEPIANGQGRVRVDDGSWLVSGPDTPKGGRVEVIGVDGAKLIVKPAGSVAG